MNKKDGKEQKNNIGNPENKVLFGHVLLLIAYSLIAFAYMHRTFPTRAEFMIMRADLTYIRDRVDDLQANNPKESNSDFRNYVIK